MLHIGIETKGLSECVEGVRACVRRRVVVIQPELVELLDEQRRQRVGEQVDHLGVVHRGEASQPLCLPDDVAGVSLQVRALHRGARLRLALDPIHGGGVAQHHHVHQH